MGTKNAALRRAEGMEEMSNMGQCGGATLRLMCAVECGGLCACARERACWSVCLAGTEGESERR